MLAAVPALLFLARSCLASSAVGMTWNSSYTFGPDGPRNALSIGIQNLNTSTRENVNLIPSTRFVYNWIPTPQACSQDKSADRGIGGEITWPILDDPADLTRNRSAGNWSYLLGGNIANMSMNFGNQVIPSATVAAFNSSNLTYPSGIERGAELGVFYLGGVNLGGDPPDVSCPDSACDPSLYLYKNGVTPSYSHGLTLGSAALGYPGSLVLGGYDNGRVLGPILIAEQQTATLIFVHQLLDVVIDVETGGNPMPPSAQTSGLLRIGSEPVSQPLLVACDPQVPYILLPSGTTEAIAAQIPVYLDPKSKYYLWDTTSPLYTRLVTSPAYLGFVFSVTSTSDEPTISNITIKVPFMLLNLTLETTVSGLKDDVPYFPIQPMDRTDYTDAYIFGRAFLQAAFWGKNWNQNVSWLAQAPGPGQSLQGLGYQLQDIAPAQTSVSAQMGANLFNESWAGYWTPLPIAAATNDSGGSSGLSGGAIAGIVVGSLAVVILLALGAWFLVRRRRKNQATEPHPAPPDDSMDKHPILPQSPRAELQGEGRGGYEMSRRPPPRPPPPARLPSELAAEHEQKHELPARPMSGYSWSKG